MADQSMEERRAEIMRKVEEARKEMEVKEKQEAKKAEDMKRKFGTHYGITCDGCQAAPVVGYRWRCTKCKNHDVCDICHEQFKAGTFVHSNKINNISGKVEDHDFVLEAQLGAGFKPMNKEVYHKEKKQKPNDPCACGSGKKNKKCCGDPAKKD
eukprot:Rhum_TRINITY_DN10902_c0_g1::Rhum_TRINITY_DN10902_c0_g1_i1::g.41137::m.41137